MGKSVYILWYKQDDGYKRGCHTYHSVFEAVVPSKEKLDKLLKEKNMRRLYDVVVDKRGRRTDYHFTKEKLFE